MGRNITTNISFLEEVWFSESFQKMKRERKLSKTINELLKSHLKVEKQDVPQDKIRIEDELRDMAARKALLTEKMERLQLEEKEQKTRYTVIE